MLFKPTLRNRATISIVAFAAFVALALGLLGYVVNESIEKTIWHSALEAELNQFMGHHNETLVKESPEKSYLRRYVSGPDATLDQQPPAPLNQLETGLHDELMMGENIVTVLVKDVGPNRVYLTYDITRLENQESQLTAIVVLGIILVGIVLTIISYWVAGLLSEPVRDLAQRVAKLKPESRGERIGGHYRDSEVATIGGAIDSYLDRLDGFVTREQEFTGAASHELRTPAAVIAGAVDVLKALPDMPTRAIKPVSRIEQAVHDMEGIIRALLYLARETDRDVEKLETCRVDQLLPTILYDHDYLAKEKLISVNIVSSEPTTISAPPMVANIVISNLVRNAIEHTDKGSVDIQLREAVLQIRNTAPMLSTVEIVENFQKRVRSQNSIKAGPSMGLHIIQRLCSHTGWDLTITSEDNVTTARLDFKSAAAHTRIACTTSLTEYETQ